MGREHYIELPPRERAAHYRKMADDTEKMGEGGTEAFRMTCRIFALRWRKLADDLERGALADLHNANTGLTQRGHQKAMGNVIPLRRGN